MNNEQNMNSSAQLKLHTHSVISEMQYVTMTATATTIDSLTHLELNWIFFNEKNHKIFNLTFSSFTEKRKRELELEHVSKT